MAQNHYVVTLNTPDSTYEDIEFSLPGDETVADVIRNAVEQTDETVANITSAVITVVLDF